MAENSSSPLDALFVDGNPLDEVLLAKLIAPYVRLYRDTTEVSTTAEWRALSIPQKVITYMLARKVQYVKKMIDDEKITPSQIESATGLKGGSIRPALAKLLDDRLIRQDKDGGGYWVADYALLDVAAFLAKKGKGNDE